MFQCSKCYFLTCYASVLFNLLRDESTQIDAFSAMIYVHTIQVKVLYLMFEFESIS